MVATATSGTSSTDWELTTASLASAPSSPSPPPLVLPDCGADAVSSARPELLESSSCSLSAGATAGAGVAGTEATVWGAAVGVAGSTAGEPTAASATSAEASVSSAPSRPASATGTASTPTRIERAETEQQRVDRTEAETLGEWHGGGQGDQVSVVVVLLELGAARFLTVALRRVGGRHRCQATGRGCVAALGADRPAAGLGASAVDASGGTGVERVRQRPVVLVGPIELELGATAAARSARLASGSTRRIWPVGASSATGRTMPCERVRSMPPARARVGSPRRGLKAVKPSRMARMEPVRSAHMSSPGSSSGCASQSRVAPQNCWATSAWRSASRSKGRDPAGWRGSLRMVGAGGRAVPSHSMPPRSSRSVIESQHQRHRDRKQMTTL